MHNQALLSFLLLCLQDLSLEWCQVALVVEVYLPFEDKVSFQRTFYLLFSPFLPSLHLIHSALIQFHQQKVVFRQDKYLSTLDLTVVGIAWQDKAIGRHVQGKPIAIFYVVSPEKFFNRLSLLINSSVDVESIVRKVSPVVLPIARPVVLGSSELPCLESGQIDGIDVVCEGRFLVSIQDNIGIINHTAHLSKLKWLIEPHWHHFAVLFEYKDYPKGIFEEKNPLFLTRPYQPHLLPLHFLLYLHLNLHILHALVLLYLHAVLVYQVFQSQSPLTSDLEGSGALKVGESAGEIAFEGDWRDGNILITCNRILHLNYKANRYIVYPLI